MRKILLTGATGFVGKQILQALSDEDVKIYPVVRSGKEKQVQGLPKVERIISTHNLFAESESWWHKQIEGIDTVIHSAWYTEPSKYLYSEENVDCLSGSIVLAKAAVSSGIKRFVGIGTCFEYDLTKCVLSVETNLSPTNTYGAAKAALYLCLSQWMPPLGISFAWCRIFNLYGDNEDERRLIPYIRNQLKNGQPVKLSSGEQIRDYLDVNVAGKIIAELSLSERTGPINICSGVPISIRQLSENIANEYGRKDLLHFGERPKKIIDPHCILGIKNYEKL